MNIHVGIYETDNTKVVLNAEEHINIIHTDMSKLRFSHHDTTISTNLYLKEMDRIGNKDPANEILEELL